MYSLYVRSLLFAFSTLSTSATPTPQSIRASGPASASQCNKGTGTPQVCVAVNVPSESDAQNDLFLKVTGSSSRAYTGVGFAASMTNCLMLLVFPSAGNVTVSMRLSSGHSRPALAAAETKAELLPGSFNDGTSFTANVRCKNCRSWGTGALPVDGVADFIYAYGTAINPEVGDKATTYYHGPLSRGYFKLDLSSAKGPGGVPTSSGLPAK